MHLFILIVMLVDQSLCISHVTIPKGKFDKSSLKEERFTLVQCSEDSVLDCLASRQKEHSRWTLHRKASCHIAAEKQRTRKETGTRIYSSSSEPSDRHTQTSSYLLTADLAMKPITFQKSHLWAFGTFRGNFRYKI